MTHPALLTGFRAARPPRHAAPTGNVVPAPSPPRSVVPASMRLRRVGPDDAGALWALCCEAAGSGLAGPSMPAALHDALFDTPCRSWAWLAESGGEVAGALLASAGLVLPQGGWCLAVDAVYVRPRWRGQGIASRLQAHALAMAAEMGCLQLRLHDGGALPVPGELPP